MAFYKRYNDVVLSVGNGTWETDSGGMVKDGEGWGWYYGLSGY